MKRMSEIEKKAIDKSQRGEKEREREKINILT